MIKFLVCKKNDRINQIPDKVHRSHMSHHIQWQPSSSLSSAPKDLLSDSQEINAL